VKTDQKLPAAERLKQKKLFDLLFESGKSFRSHPLKMVYREIVFNEEHPVRIAVIVPKRWMKAAHDRNRQKRLLREAYRLNKSGVTEICRKQQKGLAIVFMAQCKTPLSYSETEGKIILLLQRLRGVYAPVDH
jgi:ribonuclease P protein component